MGQKVFDEIKRNISHYTLIAYPYLNKLFDIHMDARYYQLRAVVIQNGKSIDLYIPKLTETQKIYTLTEKEFLSTVETLSRG